MTANVLNVLTFCQTSDELRNIINQKLIKCRDSFYKKKIPVFGNFPLEKFFDVYVLVLGAHLRAFFAVKSKF